ncbi:MAG: prepilin-type N-terminal cleavage/methylation domain-containing protein [Sideroxyarcus sp.]
MKRNQSGFTLIEIAIVLVIIGLLLGGVMKGQELINSAKVKNLATDFRNVPVYVYGYQDKYHAIPGDDANIATHLSASATQAASATAGNGVIDGQWNATGNAESHIFWEHVRLAGLAAGPTTGTPLQPVNAIGGLIGITNSGTDGPILGLPGSFIVCSNNIPGKFAQQLDISLDDGNSQTGALRVAPAGTAASGVAETNATLQANPDKPYLVCQGY